MTSFDKTQVTADDATAQAARAGELLNLVDEMLARPEHEVNANVRDQAYHLTILADTRIMLARELRERGY